MWLLGFFHYISVCINERSVIFLYPFLPILPPTLLDSTYRNEQLPPWEWCVLPDASGEGVPEEVCTLRSSIPTLILTQLVAVYFTLPCDRTDNLSPADNTDWLFHTSTSWTGRSQGSMETELPPTVGRMLLSTLVGSSIFDSFISVVDLFPFVFAVRLCRVPLISHTLIHIPLTLSILADPKMHRIRRDYIDPRSPKNVQKLNNDLNEIQHIMVENIQSVLDRGEKLDRKYSSVGCLHHI